MPYAIFFTDAGHAIHGSHATNHLGTPASHGCVRLAPRHASILFGLVRVEGGLCCINLGSITRGGQWRSRPVVDV
jgi:hypothetical protein